MRLEACLGWGEQLEKFEGKVGKMHVCPAQLAPAITEHITTLQLKTV